MMQNGNHLLVGDMHFPDGKVLLQQQNLNKENDECSCIFYLSNLLLFSPLMNFNKLTITEY